MKKFNKYKSILFIVLVFSVLLVGCGNETPADAPAEDASGDVSAVVYEGVAEGRNGNLTVEVTVEDDMVTAIEVTDHEETDGYWEEVFEQVPADIIENQSTNVEIVSGATITSNAVMEAVENALEETDLDLAALPVDEDGNQVLPEPATLISQTGGDREGIRNFEYDTQGNTCSTKVTFKINEEDRTVHDIVIYDGCDGNARGFCALAEADDLDHIIKSWSNIGCHSSEGSSCPDQIALALNEAREILYGEKLEIEPQVAQSK